MPALGEQHLNVGGKAITNPFEEVKPQISAYTAQEIATLQSRLEKQLGPEYISSRSGPSGQKVHYIAAEKCIQLANEVFGFNGWSSQIMNVQVDFFDENPTTLKVNLGLSVTVRVTLRDGTFHEDIGYGHMENCKGKAAAFEKAKKEGTTDALKRALRNFGNVLGNCIYDKEYLGKVTKIKVQPTKWDVDNLHRHSSHTLVKEPEVRGVEEKVQNESGLASLAKEDTIDEEFGDFDDADFGVVDPESHPDEVVLPAPRNASHHLSNARDSSAGRGGGTNGPASNSNMSRQNNMPAPGRFGGPQVGAGGNAVGKQQPQIPSYEFPRAPAGATLGPQARPLQDVGQPQRTMQPPQAPIIAGRVLHQPSRTGPPAAPDSPARPMNSSNDAESAGLPPQGAGFFSARAATMIPEAQGNDAIPPVLPSQLPAFNPHAESPSIRKTPGVDHKSSKPLTKDLKAVSSSPQGGAAPGPGGPRGNIINPQLDNARRIGAPMSPSPMGNRGMYKPPVIKRPADGGFPGGINGGRVPLVALATNAPVSGGEPGGEAKRQRLS